MKRESIQSFIEELKDTDYNIAIHSISNTSAEEKKHIVKNIFEEGLKLKPGWRTILATTISLRNKKENPKIVEDMADYTYCDGEQCNVIVMVPNFIVNSKGEKIFLGFPPINKDTAGQQYGEKCILDSICNNLEIIPSEFILGYYNSSLEIERSPNYYMDLSKEKQDEFFQKIKQNMTELYEKISNYVVSNNIEGLNSIRELARINRRESLISIIDNAFNIINRLDSNKKFKMELRDGINFEQNEGKLVIQNEKELNDREYYK